MNNPNLWTEAWNAPWIAGGLTLQASTLDAFKHHAEQAYPSEGCGLLSGPADAPLMVDGCEIVENLADRYHALDPETFPRTSRTYFKMHELRTQRALELGLRQGRPVKVIAHSHCDSGAYFSAEDAATFAQEGRLMWPCAFLVTSVMAGRAADSRLWVYNAESNAFDEAEYSLV